MSKPPAPDTEPGSIDHILSIVRNDLRTEALSSDMSGGRFSSGDLYELASRYTPAWVLEKIKEDLQKNKKNRTPR